MKGKKQRGIYRDEGDGRDEAKAEAESKSIHSRGSRTVSGRKLTGNVN